MLILWGPSIIIRRPNRTKECLNSSWTSLKVSWELHHWNLKTQFRPREANINFWLFASPYLRCYIMHIMYNECLRVAAIYIIYPPIPISLLSPLSISSFSVLPLFCTPPPPPSLSLFLLLLHTHPLPLFFIYNTSCSPTPLLPPPLPHSLKQES